MVLSSRIRAALQQIATQTAHSFQAQICAIHIHANGHLGETLAHGHENFSSFLSRRDLPEFFQALAALDQPVIFSTLDNHNDASGQYSSFLCRQGIQAFVAIPMKSRFSPYGTFSLFFASPRTFSENEMLYLSTVANAAALILAPESQAMPSENECEPLVENVVTQSPAMHCVFDIIKKAAPTDASVLIYGESGVGKELIAQSIHCLSRRRKNAFIPIDCVALPSNLLESELFGHEKGSFTGAVGRKPGLLELADCGTVFLDEICELDLMLQAKLLRVLQERQFRRLGGQNLINVDIRVISATNCIPEVAVREKIFREDLYFRLNVIPIHVPALRERKEDIPLLAGRFIEKFTQANHLEPKELAAETVRALQEYHWPGNVRELQNTMERVVSLCSRRLILPEDLPPCIRQEYTTTTLAHATPVTFFPAKSWREELEIFKRMYFKNLLEQTHGDLIAAARQAKVSLRTVYRVVNIKTV